MGLTVVVCSMTESIKPTYNDAVNDVLNTLAEMESRYVQHAQGMYALHAKDNIQGKIFAIQTAIRAVRKLMK